MLARKKQKRKEKKVSGCYVFRMFGVREKYFRILHSLSHTHAHAHAWDIDGIISSYSHALALASTPKKNFFVQNSSSRLTFMYAILARHWHILLGLLHTD